MQIVQLLVVLVDEKYMLENHLNAIEKVLIAQGQISSNAGHTDLIGNPREWFVKNFLIDHLPETVRVGQGEIINPRSQPKSKRNQTDVVIYHRDFPKITYSQDNHAFLRESVIATIEVKSTINYNEFKKACKASIHHKNRQYIQNLDPKRHLQPIGLIEEGIPFITTYVVAYDGPSNLSTAAKWLPKINQELKATSDKLIDMMIILGKGTVWRLDSFPPLGRQLRAKYPTESWAYIEQENKNLLLLFLHMMTLMSPIGDTVLEYVKNVPFANIKIFQ
jgi:hypothetical protein